MAPGSKPQRLRNVRTDGKIKRISTDSYVDTDDVELRRATAYLKKQKRPARCDKR